MLSISLLLFPVALTKPEISLLRLKFFFLFFLSFGVEVWYLTQLTQLQHVLHDDKVQSTQHLTRPFQDELVPHFSPNSPCFNLNTSLCVPDVHFYYWVWGGGFFQPLGGNTYAHNNFSIAEILPRFCHSLYF